MIGIIAVMAIIIVLSFALLPFMVDNNTNKINTEQSTQDQKATVQNHLDLKETPSKNKSSDIAVKTEPVKVVIKEVTPQINNYNFESLSKVLMYVLAMVGSFFSLKWFIKFFKYYKINRKFKINAKKTNKLVDSLRKTIDNQKEFLEIADMVEHQLNINDILLRSEESKTYGLDLELADGYLDKEYKFINSKIINILN
jgi:predicted PurR-regulated permease PerM